jgi:ATP-dependent NAD(P)H-hydrate dehydratase
MQVEVWFRRLSCLVVGSGLGRDAVLLDTAAAVIRSARKHGLCMIIDSDALFVVAREPSLVQGYMHCVLTPSLNEYRRFAHALGCSLNKGERAAKLQVRSSPLLSRSHITVACQ